MIQPSDSTDVHPARDSASPPVALPQRERSNANEEIATSVVHAYKYPAHRAPRVAADTWASRENVDMGHSFVREPPGYHVTARVQGLDSPPAMSPPLRPRCTSRTAPETEEARTPDSSTRDLLPSTRHRVNAGLDMDECMALMMGQGWCSHQVNYLSQIHNTAVMRQFAAMDRRNERPEDHRPCLQQDHCVAYNSPLTQEYRTKHAQPCGEETCYTVQVPHRALIQVLKSGGVPLLSIHQGLTGALSFKVHRRQYWSKYVSVSHIWADGLGNLTENGLPACQVRRLLWDLQVMASRNLSGLLSYDNNVWQGLGDEQTAIYVKEMVKPLFWMDTLCIPVQPELRDLKERCIGKMASIYARSLFVLVLDKELMGVEWGQNQDWPEAWPDPWHFAYLIAASAWMCRNWTLQEAVLSQRPVFKCKDALFYLDHRWITQAERSLHAEQSGLFKVLWYDLLGARRPGTSAFEPTKSEDLETLTRAWNRLVGRSTTEAADLDVVLINCLGFTYHQVRKFDKASRLQHMLFSFKVLPFSLFFNAGPRLHAERNHRNRWVPTEVSRHLLKGSSTFDLPPKSVSKYSDEGMRLKLSLDQDVDVIFLDHVVPAMADYTMSAENDMWQVHAHLPTADEFDSSGCRSTCFVVERASSDWQATVKGAFFYVQHLSSVYVDGEEVPALEMIYFCPVEALKITRDSSSLREARNVDSIGPCRIMHQNTKLTVLFDPISNFKPLAQHARISIAYSCFLACIFCGYIIVLIGVALYGCFHWWFPLLLRIGASQLSWIDEWISQQNGTFLTILRLLAIPGWLAYMLTAFGIFLLGCLLIFLLLALFGFLTVSEVDVSGRPIGVLFDGGGGNWMPSVAARMANYWLGRKIYLPLARTASRACQALSGSIRNRREHQRDMIMDSLPQSETAATHRDEDQLNEDAQVAERRNEEQRTWRQRHRQAARAGKEFGQRSWKICRERVIPVVVWPFWTVISSLDAFSRWQIRAKRRIGTSRGIVLEDTAGADLDR